MRSARRHCSGIYSKLDGGEQTGSFPFSEVSSYYEPSESCETNIRKRSVCPRVQTPKGVPPARLGLNKPNGYLLGSYRIATAPEPNSSRLTSLKSIRFDSPANNVGPWPASLGCTTNSYSSINPSSANACGSFTPPTHSPLPDSRLSC